MECGIKTWNLFSYQIGRCLRHVLVFNYSCSRQLAGCPRTSGLLGLKPTSHHLLRPFFFLTLSQRRVLQTISKMTLENNVSLSRSNHLQDCTSVWRARQFFTLFSVAVVSPSLPSCFRVGNTFLNQNSCLILSLASSSRLQAVTDSFLHLVVITTAWPFEKIRL